ncbi:type 4a pilus biogenesis protein PilO [Massilia sp. CF038]|uniref:type 4a pilus biogenesis protein PilO n=1 Tax=Massilia sp. CF038 TaxID=1881045 RepID=UPI00091552EA|nr:type 4a pilus biogenesis protein PilO [Massilia sp. CF038]SHH61118.1 type IV pilus assembly protein PilO [Massilia sp. CF038]
MNIDLKDLGKSLSSQFQNLSGLPPGQWPLAPRILCGLGVVAAVVVGGYFAYWQGQFEEHDALAATELTLRDQYKSKMAQAINLEALKMQKVQVDQYVERLQKQLPSKAEMAALLSDINQAGVGRGLTFTLFKPGSVVVKDYYAELPIEIRVNGNYHDVGAFASDMANLPRIVTLNNMSLSATKDGDLQLDAVAKTFRYLDQEEVAAQRQSAAEAAAKAKGKK